MENYDSVNVDPQLLQALYYIWPVLSLEIVSIWEVNQREVFFLTWKMISINFLKIPVLEGKAEDKQIYFKYCEVLWVKEETVTSHEAKTK